MLTGLTAIWLLVHDIKVKWNRGPRHEGDLQGPFIIFQFRMKLTKFISLVRQLPATWCHHYRQLYQKAPRYISKALVQKERN